MAQFKALKAELAGRRLDVSVETIDGVRHEVHVRVHNGDVVPAFTTAWGALVDWVQARQAA